MSNFKDDEQMEEKLDKFIDRVAFRVEEALQSNEIINVFQDDFENSSIPSQKCERADCTFAQYECIFPHSSW